MDAPVIGFLGAVRVWDHFFRPCAAPVFRSQMAMPESVPTASIPATPSGWALFDLDHTLLPHDTQVLFANFVLRREGWRRLYLMVFLPLAVLGGLRLIPLRTLKRVFSCYLWRMPLARLRGYAKEFAATVLPRVQYPEIVAELERHRVEGRELVLNSASPSLYVGEIAAALGFHHWVATRMEASDPMPFFPRIDGPNNKHGAKIDAMRESGLLPVGFDATGGARLPDSWGYSDSAADIPLLSICENGVMIHPGKRFAAHGAKERWQTLLPARPYRGKWGDRWATLLQMAGLYRIPEPND